MNTTKKRIMTAVSIFIHRVISKYDEDDIITFLENARVGKSITVHLRTFADNKGSQYKTAVANVKHWMDDELLNELKTANTPVKLFYDGSWYWNISLYNNQPGASTQRKQRIHLTEPICKPKEPYNMGSISFETTSEMMSSFDNKTLLNDALLNDHQDVSTLFQTKQKDTKDTKDAKPKVTFKEIVASEEKPLLVIEAPTNSVKNSVVNSDPVLEPDVVNSDQMLEDIDDMMEEEEQITEEDEKNLVTIDGRYVQMLEQQVQMLQQHNVFLHARLFDKWMAEQMREHQQMVFGSNSNDEQQHTV